MTSCDLYEDTKKLLFQTMVVRFPAKQNAGCPDAQFPAKREGACVKLCKIYCDISHLLT